MSVPDFQNLVPNLYKLLSDDLKKPVPDDASDDCLLLIIGNLQPPPMKTMKGVIEFFQNLAYPTRL